MPCHLGNSNQLTMSIDIFLPSHQTRTPISRTYLCYQRTDWDSFRVFLHDGPCNDIVSFLGVKVAMATVKW